MEWQEIYKSKLVSAEEAVKQVKSGDMVVPGHNCAEPRYLMKVLCETRGMELENVGILQGLNEEKPLTQTRNTMGISFRCAIS